MQRQRVPQKCQKVPRAGQVPYDASHGFICRTLDEWNVSISKTVSGKLPLARVRLLSPQFDRRIFQRQVQAHRLQFSVT